MMNTNESGERLSLPRYTVGYRNLFKTLLFLDELSQKTGKKPINPCLNIFFHTDPSWSEDVHL